MSVQIWLDTDRGVVVSDVLDERERQDEKFGVQNHDPFAWLAILSEEVGETANAALSWRFGPRDVIREGIPGGELEQLVAAYRAECVQVAAVALAMVECLDRHEWRWTS